MLSLYRRLLPNEFFDELRRRGTLQEHNRVYTAAVVMWLMIAQRLQGQSSLVKGVLELVCGLPESFWPKPCKRLQRAAADPASRLSGNTGSYSNGRQTLPAAVVEQSVDEVVTQLTAETNQPGERRVCLLDGSSLQMPSTKELREIYPPGSNQHGQSHWPRLRMLVAHDLHTGLAVRAEWGAMSGEEVVSEQGLLKKMLPRLPAGVTLLGDANFGVFSVAYGATQHGHPVILRLTTVRAEHLLGGPLQDGVERRMRWQPTREDRRQTPELAAEAQVEGKVIVRQVQPSNGAPVLLALFTTDSSETGQIVEWYGKRWDIENDLRSLKSTLELGKLTCTNPEMVAKEIHLGLLTYNLVRAVTYRVAKKTGRAPRSFSFKRVLNVLQAFAPKLAAARNEQEALRVWEDIEYYVAQAKLSRRKRKSYPRSVWPQPFKYPQQRE